MRKIIFLLLLAMVLGGCQKEYVGKTLDITQHNFPYCNSILLPCEETKTVGDFEISYIIKEEGEGKYIFEGTAKLLKSPFSEAKIGSGAFRLILIAEGLPLIEEGLQTSPNQVQIIDSIRLGFKDRTMGNLKLYKEFTVEHPFQYTAITYRLKSF